uniref:Ig-like domain-containing protein n=1 Tax=Salmo trutta TaxID=8032 RepID=A0A673VXJ7_SALTR
EITKRRLLYCVYFDVLAGIESSSIHQESGLMSANVGDTVILQCFHESDMAVLFSWYKQTSGDKLQFFSTLIDSGTYYCGSSYSNNMEFGEGNWSLRQEVLQFPSQKQGSFWVVIKVEPRSACKKLLHLMLKIQFCFSQAQDGDSLHYVALNLSNKKNRCRRQRSNMEQEMVYSGIRQ